MQNVVLVQDTPLSSLSDGLGLDTTDQADPFQDSVKVLETLIALGGLMYPTAIQNVVLVQCTSLKLAFGIFGLGTIDQESVRLAVSVAEGDRSKETWPMSGCTGMATVNPASNAIMLTIEIRNDLAMLFLGNPSVWSPCNWVVFIDDTVPPASV
jgi:hypothetical protein